MTPTGSRDPFGLRRAAQGIVRLIVEGRIKAPPLEGEFLRDRVEYYFRDVRGFAYDEVRACMAAGWSDLIDLESRLQRVKAIRTTPDFEPIAASFKRIKNILKQASFFNSQTLDVNLLEAGPEQDLYFETRRTRGQPLESSIGPLRPEDRSVFRQSARQCARFQAFGRNRLDATPGAPQPNFPTIADFSEIVTERQS